VRDIYELGAARPNIAAGIAIGMSVALIAVAVLAFLRARRRSKIAAEEAASIMDPTALQEGEVVLSGVVEHAEGHDVAVRVEITQEGSESESSGSWSHRWTEVDRETKVAPFYLKLADGTRVRVEPPRTVEVADDLDGKVLISQILRKRTAELIPGETVHAHGWIERGGDAEPSGYRDVAWGWVLRPANGRMMLSSHPLGEGLKKRAAFHRRFAIRALVVLGIFQIVLFGYYRRALAGSVDEAVVIDRQMSTYEDSDGDTQHDYTLILAVKGATQIVEVYEDDWELTVKGEHLPILRNNSTWELGERPTMSYPRVVILIVLALGVMLLYKMRRVSSRPWFRRKVVDLGSGRLTNKTGS
jgi:hypothetical protein